MKQVTDMNDYISPLYRDNLKYKWYQVIFNFIKKIFVILVENLLGRKKND